VLNMQPDDEFHDLFYGSGSVTTAWNMWRSKLPIYADKKKAI